jgi:hypothetical protein
MQLIEAEEGISCIPGFFIIVIITVMFHGGRWVCAFDEPSEEIALKPWVYLELPRLFLFGGS